MHIRIAALVLALLQLCAGVTHVDSVVRAESTGGTAVALDGHGNMHLAADGVKDQHVDAIGHERHEASSHERAALLRQEEDDTANKTGSGRHRTMQERRKWARTHGNVFATRRMLGQTMAWSSYYATKVPTTVTSSFLVPIVIAAISIGFLISIAQCIARMRQPSAREVAEGDGGSGGSGEIDPLAPFVEHEFKRSPQPLEEDIYGMGVAALIRDMQRVAAGSESKGLRISRMLISLLTLIFTMTLQTFLLVEMKLLVTSVSTNEAQDTYEKYEVWMYGNDRSNMTKLPDGEVRGVPGNFDMKKFSGLDDQLKDAICQVPLSQPTFFIAILLVWTLVCTNELRNAFDMAGSLIISTPTIPDMKDSIQETPEQGDEAMICIGLSIPVKIACIVLVVIPRIFVTCTLLWLGCRWLTGTFGFSDVLQNAVALEFILLLKYVFYDAITPAHNKKETSNTHILPFAEKETPSTSVFLGAFTWGVVAVVWVFFYILAFQRVLPDYQWDIHDACVGYLAGVQDATPGS